MRAEETKDKFAKALLELTETHALSQISTSMIINACGKNHNTFYYHFKDKTTLFLWIFRRDLGGLLCKCDDSIELVYEEKPAAWLSLPYYARKISGIRSVDNSFFMRCLFETLDAQLNFYRQVFTSEFRNDIERYCLTLLEKALNGDLDTILAGRFLPKEDRELIISYHAAGILGFVEKVIADPESTFCRFAYAHFINHIPDSMSFEVENRRF